MPGVWDPFGPWAPFTMKSAPLKCPGKEQKEEGRQPTRSDIPSTPTLLFQGPIHSAFKKQNLSSWRRGWIMQVMKGYPRSLLSPPHPPFSPLPRTPLPPAPVDTKVGLPASPCRLSTSEGCTVDKAGQCAVPLGFFSKLPGPGTCPWSTISAPPSPRHPAGLPAQKTSKAINAHSSRQKSFYLRAHGARALASRRSSLGAASARPGGKHLVFTHQAEKSSFSEDTKASGSHGSSSKGTQLPGESPPARTQWMAEINPAQSSGKQGGEREKEGQRKQCGPGRRQGAAGPHLQVGHPQASSSVPHRPTGQPDGPSGAWGPGTPEQGSPLLGKKLKNLNRGGKWEKAGVFIPSSGGANIQANMGALQNARKEEIEKFKKHPSRKNRVPRPPRHCPETLARRTLGSGRPLAS